MDRNSLPKAVQDCHTLLIWLIPLLDNFPRNRRFTLGERLESGLLEILKMKRLGRIWPKVISFENLLSAYRKVRKGKQSKSSVAEFTLNLESELLGL